MESAHLLSDKGPIVSQLPKAQLSLSAFLLDLQLILQGKIPPGSWACSSGFPDRGQVFLTILLAHCHFKAFQKYFVQYFQLFLIRQLFQISVSHYESETRVYF